MIPHSWPPFLLATYPQQRGAGQMMMSVHHHPEGFSQVLALTA